MGQRTGDELQKEPVGGISRVVTLQVEVRKQRNPACAAVPPGQGSRGRLMLCAGVHSVNFFLPEIVLDPPHPLIAKSNLIPSIKTWS